LKNIEGFRKLRAKETTKTNVKNTPYVKEIELILFNKISVLFK